MARKQENLSIAEAIEHLATVAHGDPAGKLRDPDKTAKAVRDSYRVILEHLREYHDTHYMDVGDIHHLEGIKNIMVLVGEAAKKVNRLTALFQGVQEGHGAVQDREYQDLQDFYRDKIIREAYLSETLREELEDEELAGLGIIQRVAQSQPLSDLETIRADGDYELFYLRREDGSRFFSPDLVRSIRLVTNYGDYLSQDVGEDPLLQVRTWLDKSVQVSAKAILKAVRYYLDEYYREAMRHKDLGLVVLLNKTTMALMLASNPRNLLRNFAAKTCYEYSLDFHSFLREALTSQDYQRLLAFPPNKSQKFYWTLLELSQGLCRAYFDNVQGKEELATVLDQLVHWKAPEASDATDWTTFLDQITSEYERITALLQHYPNGPLFKTLDLFHTDVLETAAFDPLRQDNLPGRLYQISVPEGDIVALRTPAPVYQEYIHKASVVDEFKGFLQAYAGSPIPKQHLLINLQDRTSNREYQRCVALENLQNLAEYANTLTVVTLAKDTEFYYQLAPYHDINRAEAFLEAFEEQLLNDGTGFYFPKEVRQLLDAECIRGLLHTVHKQFFSGKASLSRRDRLDFIEIYYLFLELKVIDITKADSLSFVSKDSIDVGGTDHLFLYAALRLFKKQKITPIDRDFFRQMLIGLPLLIRERVLLNERFHRLIQALRALSTARPNLRAFTPYIASQILSANVSIPKEELHG